MTHQSFLEVSLRGSWNAQHQSVYFPGVGGDCVGMEPNFHRPPPLICGLVPLLARSHRTVKRAFSNLPGAHKYNLLQSHKKEKKETHLRRRLVTVNSQAKMCHQIPEKHDSFVKMMLAVRTNTFPHKHGLII